MGRLVELPLNQDLFLERAVFLQLLKETFLESLGSATHSPYISLSLPAACEGGGVLPFFFLRFRAIPKAYGDCQASGLIGATAMQDLSRICDLHHSSQQRQIPNPLSEARDRTCIPWMLVGFISAAPQQELLCFHF